MSWFCFMPMLHFMPGRGATRIPYAPKSRISPRELTAAERVIFSDEPRVDDVARLGGGPSEDPRARPGQIIVLRFD
jgi:hypothetical protein